MVPAASMTIPPSTLQQAHPSSGSGSSPASGDQACLAHCLIVPLATALGDAAGDSLPGSGRAIAEALLYSEALLRSEASDCTNRRPLRPAEAGRAPLGLHKQKDRNGLQWRLRSCKEVKVIPQLLQWQKRQARCLAWPSCTGHKPRGDGVPAAWQRLCKGCTRLALRRVNIYQLAGYNNFRLWHMAQPVCKQGSLSGNS